MKEIKREKVWEEKYTLGDKERDSAIKEMAYAMRVSELFAILLYNRGYRSAQEAERFLRFEQSDFHDPFLLADMDKAVDRIMTAVKSKEKITIYGDYDVDGVTSVTTLYLYLTSLGAEVGIKIPKREGEGYGVSCAAIDTLALDGTSLVITVDTGITANDEVEYAKSLGIDFVVTDHHECRAELPKACAVVNPHRPDCTYPFSELAGVGVVFKVLCACEMSICREKGEPIIDGVRRICMEYADLTAIGTIADVMPVVDENRLIVSLGLKLMENSKREGLKALIDAAYSRKGADDSKKKITSGMVGFGIAPRINAAGRISDAAIAVKLLLENNAERARLGADELCEINRRRQEEENDIATEAYRQLETLPYFDDELVLVLDSNNWHPGIIGIVSSRITERYGLPSILVSFEGTDGQENVFDDGKGSGRSIKGLNLVEALNYCDDLLVKYGGHELAAGLTLKRGNLEAFRKKINEYAREHLTEDMLKIRMEADCALEMGDLSMDFVKEISRLEPFGVGNASPIFVMKDVTVKKLTALSNGKHSRMIVEKDGATVTAICFGSGPIDLSIKEGDLADILFHLDINEYKGVKSVQMIVQDIRPASSYKTELDRQIRRYAEICQGDSYTSSENVLPTRDDFADVYKVLRKESRSGRDIIDIAEMFRLINGTPMPTPMNYIKLKYILRVMSELKLCEIEELPEDPDVYRFSVLFNATKTSIDKSSILKKLRGQCADR